MGPGSSEPGWWTGQTHGFWLVDRPKRVAFGRSLFLSDLVSGPISDGLYVLRGLRRVASLSR